MSDEVSFRSLDGLRLRGTLVRATDARNGVAVMVHGGGVTRDEGGFFTRIADGLAGAGISSLRFDLRGHGESEGRQEELTMCGILNDIRAAVTRVAREVHRGPVHLFGASFGGGICAFFAANHPEDVQSLVLVNPLLNYKKRFIDDKAYWHDDQINEAAGSDLISRGFLAHSPTFRLGRPLLNEVFYVRPHDALRDIKAPVLFIHGTRDTFIPVDSSRSAVRKIKPEARLMEVEGAQHGIAVHDDPGYEDPQTREWQAAAVRSMCEWVTAHS